MTPEYPYISYNDTCYDMNFNYTSILESVVCILADFINTKYCQ